MSDKEDKFSGELDKLIEYAGELQNAMWLSCRPDDFKAKVKNQFKGDNDKYEEFLREVPDFGAEYQTWYSVAQAVIKQVLPDRLADFVSHYEHPRNRKQIDYQSYVIRDFLQGIVVTRIGAKDVDGSAAISQFTQQVNILKAARKALQSSLMDLKSVVQADLFDSEIDASGALAKSGYLRAAGAICGVVLEKHLQHVCDIHKIKVTKKNPGISDLIQLLKDNNTITVTLWRFIQSLADTRNICDHALQVLKES
jgi:Asp-tRNA(Asn)/Glu-tRNA(Gln) amidotransferase C subunit